MKQNEKLGSLSGSAAQHLGAFKAVIPKASHLFSASLLKSQMISPGRIYHMDVCFDKFLILMCMHTDFKPRAQPVDNNFQKYKCLASKAHE